MADEELSIGPSDSDILYEECNKAALDCEEKFRKTFNQDELLAVCKSAGLGKVFNTTTLMPLVQVLTTSNLLITLKQKGGSLCWSLRPRDAAKQMQKLNAEDRMVYVMIEESHSNGVWVRNIKKRSNLTDQGVNKVVDKLSKLSLIKAVKNIRAPAQKTFMLYHLAPSDDVTGGSFYDGGELDENLVDELANLIVFHVRQASWVEEKRKRVKHEVGETIVIADDEQADRSASPEATRGRKKRKISHTNDIEDGGAPAKKTKRSHEDAEGGCGRTTLQLSHPAGHDYPDAKSIHEYITGNGLLRESKAASLSVEEVQNIVNMLVWDAKLEKVNGGYRSVRGIPMPDMGKPDDDEVGVDVRDLPEMRGNGLTEMPCGRCPVLEVCGKGGPISAETCVYFDRWLGIAVDGPEQAAGVEVEIMG